MALKHPAVEKVIKETRAADVQRLASSGTPRLKELADAATQLFEEYEGADQIVVLALLLGMLWATWQGHATDFERDNSLILTIEDRKAMFLALVDVVYREAAEAGEAFGTSAM